MIETDPMGFNLFNDVMAQVVFIDKLAVQHVLRIILRNDKLVVVEVMTQRRVSQLRGRDVVLDVLVRDEDGRLFGVEIQRSSACDHARRVRFYGAMVDSRYLPKGSTFADLPDLYIIYISEKDIWREGRAVYTVRKSFAESGTEYNDGLHVIYVNAEVDDGSAAAILMRYFLTADADDPSQGDLSKRVKFVKLDEGGRHVMKEYSQLLREDGAMERTLLLVRNLMGSLKCTVESAMDALKLTGADREYCLANIAQPA